MSEDTQISFTEKECHEMNLEFDFLLKQYTDNGYKIIYEHYDHENGKLVILDK